MTRSKIIALLLAGVLVFGVAAPVAYALPDCGMGMSAAPMRMEGCGGGSGCCGCEVKNSFPEDPVRSAPAVTQPLGANLFEEVEQPGNFLSSLGDSQPSDPGEEKSSYPEKLYDLYSDYRL